MPRVTIITMQLHTPGGIERFISTLASMLSKDYQVEIIANYGHPSDSPAFSIPDHVKLTFLTPKQPAEISLKQLITHLKWHQIPAELSRRKNIANTQNQAFHNYLKNLDTDYIITDRANYSHLVTKYYHGKAKKIATDHNFHQNNSKYIHELLNSIASFDALVLATNELRDFYANKTSIPCHSIPNPLPSIPIKKTPLTTKNIISVGRLVPEKDFSLLINAMKYVHEKDPNIHLTIVGDGIEKSKLQLQIHSSHLENTVTLTGWLSQPEIAKLYYDSSLFVMTSKTEAFGLVLSEAMSYGLPCLALSRASGAKAQITANIGLLLDTDDPITIAENILSLLHSPAKLQKYQNNISPHIQRYSTSDILKQWQSLLS